MTSLTSELLAIRQALIDLQFSEYVHVSTFTILVYEYAITLDAEITYIWGSHWGLMKVLYLLTRYSPFIDTSLLIFRHFLPYLSSRACFDVIHTTTWFVMVGMTLAEAIFTLRTWVTWGGKKWLTCSLSVSFVGLWAAGYYTAARSVSTIKFDAQAIMPRGCLITAGDTTMFTVNWSLLFFYDFGNLTLMMIPATQTFKQKGKSQMTKAIFRDGIIYYLCIFIISLANLVVVGTLRPNYFDIIILLGRIIHSVLACRVVLHARELGHSQSIEITRT